jgi:uncharacterized membrane protein
MTDQFQPVPPSPAPVPPPAQSGLSDNSAGGLAYLTFIPALIFLIVEPYNRNPFIKFHAWQSILLTGAYIAWFIVRMVLAMVLHFLWFIWALIGLVVFLGFFIVWLIAIIQAFNGKKFSIPVIGAIAEKQANS